MVDQNNREIVDRLIHTCAWCTLLIPTNSETFGFGARASHNVDLIEKEGQFVSINLSLAQKTTVALVIPEDSPARQAGFDLFFITCSRNCVEQLKGALQFELDVYDGLDPDLDETK